MGEIAFSVPEPSTALLLAGVLVGPKGLSSIEIAMASTSHCFSAPNVTGDVRDRLLRCTEMLRARALTVVDPSVPGVVHSGAEVEGRSLIGAS